MLAVFGERSAREGSTSWKEAAMGAKIPPQMWEKPEAFEDVPSEDEPREGVVDDLVGHSEARDHGDHEHGPDCGHDPEQHGDHVDYVHDGARHYAHDGHWDSHD
jgi:hypothetical protein